MTMDRTSSKPEPSALPASPRSGRTSLSIFSRPSTELPLSKSSSFSQNTMGFHKDAAAAHRSWKKKLHRTLRRDESATILHAVPLASATLSSSVLQHNTQPSPNDEILAAISRGTKLDAIPIAAQKKLGLNTATRGATGAMPPNSQSSSPVSSRIGVWRDGVTTWDFQAQSEAASPVLEQKIETEDWAGSVLDSLPYYFEDPVEDNPMRPKLFVTVPRRKISVPNLNTTTLATRRTGPFASVSCTSLLLQNGFNVPRRVLDPTAIHPALRTPSGSSEHSRSSPHRNRKKDQSEPSIHETLSASMSSSSSSGASVDDASDRASNHSQNTSMTSVHDDLPCDELEKMPNVPFRETDWKSEHWPIRMTSTPFTVASPVGADVFDEKTRSDLESPLPCTNIAETGPPSPSLSEVFQDLQSHLSTIPENLHEASAQTQTAHALSHVPSRAPTIPKKSRKRLLRAQSVALEQLTMSHTTPLRLPQRKQSFPLGKENQGLLAMNSIAMTPVSIRSTDMDVSDRHDSVASEHLKTNHVSEEIPQPACNTSSPAEAQAVLFRVMSALSSLDDLHAMASINKGMRHVYKKNEMFLLQTVLRTQSPAAWELREWSPPAQFDELPSPLTYIPATYMAGVVRDGAVVASLKEMIVYRCQDYLRPETAEALTSKDNIHAQRFDDAFYRIWSFCRIFGCDKEREDDIVGQLDWLRGGVLAHQQKCVATVDINQEFDVASVLLNSPEYFAKGNLGGLTTDQLYDMTEIWHCLTSLLQGYAGRTKQARACGIFDCTDTRSLEQETAALEEWIAYLLTLGPSVILEMARFSDNPSDMGLKFAKLQSWTEWTPLDVGASRQTFLKEPVVRLWQELSIARNVQSSRPGARRIHRRTSSLAAEIKLARGSSGYHSRQASNDMSSAMGQEGARPTTSMSQRSWVSGTEHALSPTQGRTSEQWNRMSLEGHADDTSERAVRKIVNMGFSPKQASDALRLTDMGNGLNMDRALEWLLRQC